MTINLSDNQSLEINSQTQLFYKKHGASFDKTRQSAWEGWLKLLPNISNISSCLDVGCGNGRFAKFLTTNFAGFNYTGLDSDEYLLNAAKKELNDSEINANFILQDVIKDLIMQKNKFKLAASDRYDLIVAFGLLHHIPGYENRLQFFKTIRETINEKNTNAKFIISIWDFINDDKIKNKLIKNNNFEKNDYFLGWQNDNSLLRYCHWMQETELQEILEQTGWSIDSHFLADGKSHQLNRYYILCPN